MSRIYLDSNVLIYLFDQNLQFGPVARSIVDRIYKNRHSLCSSLFVLGEISVAPVQNGDEFRMAAFNRMFSSPELTLLPYPLAAVPIYATLRAHHRVRPLDAFHLACAAHAGVDLFLTNDITLTRLTIPGIGAVSGMDTEF